MTKKRAAAGLLLCSAVLLYSDGWYISNAAGMTLEPAFSSLALRADYALEVRTVGIWLLPPRLAEALRGGLIPAGAVVEEHILYEKGEPLRTRWQVIDGVVRAAASFRDDGSGYMDIFNEQGVLTEERNYSSDDVTIIVKYSYRSGRLLKAESFKIRPEDPADQEDAAQEEDAQEDAAQDAAAQDAPAQEDAVLPVDAAAENAVPSAQDAAAQEEDAQEEDAALPDSELPADVAAEENAGPRRYVEEVLWTDVYRYSRSSALRSIERRYPGGADAGDEDAAGEGAEEQRSETAFFPRLPGRRTVERLVSPYSAFSSDFLMDITALDAAVEFTTDERGRILTEARRDGEGELLGTLTNTWTGERLSAVLWEAEHESRLIEFEYDSDGNRTGEKNYRDGVLERSVVSEGNRDVEDLYLDGKPVLRAVWEDGRKISEEAVKPDRP